MHLWDKEKWKESRILLGTMSFFMLLFLFMDWFWPTRQEVLPSKLIINEIMTSNKGAYADPEGNCYDWIELYNGESHDISLKGYTITDGKTNNTYTFSDKVIPKGGYLVLYLTGKEVAKEDDIYLPFALDKKKEETITLKDQTGKVVDSVTIEPIPKNTSFAKKEDYIVTSEITPGYPNTTMGRIRYLKNFPVKEDSLVLSEVLPNNLGIYQKDGSFYEYIELENRGEEPISLKDYYLSNDPALPFLWKLPDVVLNPGEFYLVYPTKIEKEGHTNFTLEKEKGTILLSHQEGIVDIFSYQVQEKGYAIERKNSSLRETSDITPGYSNDSSGRKAYLETLSKKEELLIQEIMPSNDRYLRQKDGNYYDWIELYNNTNHTISLKDYALTEKEKLTKGYELPDVNLAPHESFVVFASGNPSLTTKGNYHLNFKVSEKETLYLYHGEELVDAIYLPEIKNGYSYGRGAGNGLYYFATPTPSKGNGQGQIGISSRPEFSLASGIYENSESLTIEILGEGNIYYTLDGSKPTSSSNRYHGPITISKTTVVRAIAYEDEKASSEITTGSYVLNENHTLPVVSLSLDNWDLDQLHTNYNSWSLIYPAHVEFYEKNGSFSVDCGLKLFGGQSRELDKKSYALKFSSKYGEKELSYKVFENRDTVSYNTLVLRSGSQDMSGSMLRDELSAAVMEMAATVDVQAYKPVILYINGNYWGIYYLREKIDDDFISSHYNVPQEGTNIVKIEGEVDEGSGQDYQSLLAYVQSHDLTDNQSYEYVEKHLDIDNYIDFLVGQFYTNNIDIRNTRYFNHPAISNNKLRMIFYDLDYGFRLAPANYLTWLLNEEGTGYFKVDNSLIKALMSNEKFRQKFLDIFFYDLKYVFTEEKVMAKFEEIYQVIEPEMRRNQERWGFDYSVWQSNCSEIRRFIKNRQKNMISIVKNYFHLTDKQVNTYMIKDELHDSIKRKTDILNSSLKG